MVALLDNGKGLYFSEEIWLMVSTLIPNALCTAFSKAASGQCMRSSLSLSVSVTLEALTYWFHLTLNCLKSSWLLPPLISGLGILD